MTTFVTYTQSPNQIFSFNAVLDGASYTLGVPWNLYGQRFYLACLNQQNTVIFNVPLIGSPDYYDINLTAGYFQTPIIFRESTQTFEIG